MTNYKNIFEIQEVVNCCLFPIFTRFSWSYLLRSKPIVKESFMFYFQMGRLNQDLSLK